MKIRVVFATPYVQRAEFVIVLDPSRFTENQIAGSLQSGVLYEQITSWVMIGLLRDGDVAVDIGAHVGYYTLLMRTLVGGKGRVFAAEPEPQSHEALRDNVSINQFENVHVANLAISDQIGQQFFTVDGRNEGESHLSAFSDRALCGQNELTVATSTLDAWLGQLESAPRLIKIDAEGCETKILKGGMRFFERVRPQAVICEINPPALLRHGSDQFELRQLFKQMGYDCFLINHEIGGPFDLCEGAYLKPMEMSDQVSLNVVHNLLFALPDVRPIGLGL